MAVSVEHFIITWQHANTLAEVVEKTGMASARSASSKASALRREGIPLKKFATGVHANKAELREIAQIALADARAARKPVRATPPLGPEPQDEDSPLDFDLE